MSNSKKSFDVDSTYRNRNNYPNPYDFVIPYSFPNKGSTTSTFFDPVLDSSPFTGSPTLQPGELLTGVSVDTSNITLSASDTNINNYYINVTLQLGIEFRTIINYNGSTRVATVDAPFSSLPSAGTIYYTRRVSGYLSSNVAIIGYDSATNTVNRLNLLTATPSPSKDFYAGSYIRYTNGPHVGETSLITGYDPTGILTAWSQTNNLGYNEYLSLSTPYGFIFNNDFSGTITQIILNIETVEKTLANRIIEVKILNGATMSSSSIYTNNFNISPASQGNVTLSLSGPTILGGGYYTLSLQDVTVGGSGYINIFGIDTRTNSTYTSFNTFLYPYLQLTVAGGSGTSDWLQSTNNSSSYGTISTTGEIGFRFIPTLSGVINTLGFRYYAKETVSGNRTVTFRIRSGAGVGGTILYSQNLTLLNANTYTQSVLISPFLYITSGSTYTLTLEDITVGGTSTGYSKFVGIASDLTYISYNTTAYPQFSTIVSTVVNQTVSQQGSKLVGTGGISVDWQGIMTSIDQNGTTLAVGAPGQDGAAVGRVFVFTRSDTTWSQEQMITFTGNSGNSNIGRAIYISEDGNTIAVGGYADNSNQGAIWIATRSGGVWTQVGSKLIGTGNSGAAQQGFSVYISGDGQTVAWGGYADNSQDGAVWVFTVSSNVWTQQGSKLVGTGAVGGAGQGFAVALTDDGNTLVSSGPFDNGNIGAVWVFTRSAGVWTQFGSKLVGSPVNVALGSFNQGWSMDVSGDGNTLVIGALNYSYLGVNGAVFVFVKSLGVWVQQGNELTGITGLGNESSTRLSRDGNTLVAGSPSFNSGVGGFNIFSRSGVTWTNTQTVQPSGNSGNSNFGRGVDISSNATHICAGGFADNSFKGATWVFTSIQTAFNQSTNNGVFTELTPSTEFGFQFTSISGLLTNLLMSLTTFEAVDTGRTIRLRIRSGSGLAGTILYSNNFIISNNININDNDFTLISTLLSAGTYTITITDLTAGGSSTGNTYIYGITQGGSYTSFSTTTYPRLNTFISPLQSSFSQLTNQTVSNSVSTVTEAGWSFVPSFSGFMTRISFNVTVFSTTTGRTIQLRVRSGAGVAGSILYNSNITIPNLSSRTDYIIDLDTSLAPVLSSGSTYTITILDISAGGTTTGNVNVYGISSSPSYTSYNMSTYPRLFVYVPSFIITISPPADYDGFLDDNTDNIEFNTQAHENATTIYYNGLNSRTSFYQIGLKYLIIPNQLLKVGLGGHLDSYPYVYVQLYNEGNNGNLKTLFSNNQNSILALFKVPINKDLYGDPTSFFTLKTISREQIINFRPDQDVRFKLTLPDGTVIENVTNDNLSPLYPNPFLQINALFTIFPVNIY